MCKHLASATCMVCTLSAAECTCGLQVRGLDPQRCKHRLMPWFKLGLLSPLPPPTRTPLPGRWPEAALMECWMFKLCKSADCTLEQLAGLVDIDRV
ncbi:hypothetical protein ABBQ38_004689 [Trebouxia sp. C0009 RCD-2024]